MPSQLWQRLRAARKYADLRQQDVAAACKVNRSAVALWESTNPDQRTRPELHQIPILAKLYGLPVEWLMNDAANVDDVWRIGALHKPAASVPVAPLAGEMALGYFAKATEFELMQIDSTLLSGFTAGFGAGLTRVKPDFAIGDLVVQFSVPSGDNMDMDAIGRLLLLEKAAGHPLRKVLLVWVKEGETANKSIFDIVAIPVRSPAEAASHLVRLAK